MKHSCYCECFYYTYKSGISILEIPLLLANCATVNAAARMSTVPINSTGTILIKSPGLS